MLLVHFYIRVEINHQLVIRSVNAHSNRASIDVNYNFTNQDVPSDTEITLHGISKETAEKVHVGQHVDLYAGHFNSDYTENDIAHVLSANITSLIPLHNDSGDWQLQINIQDGDNDFSNKKLKIKQSKAIRVRASNRNTGYRNKIHAYIQKQHSLRNAWLAQNSGASRHQKHLRYLQMENNIKNYRTQLKGSTNRENRRVSKLKTYRKKTVYKFLSFKPGTHGSAIIRSIARRAGINISKMHLVYNKIYVNGYTAKKKPIDCIKDVAKECQTDMYYQHGKLVIKSFASNEHLSYVCTKYSGLITPPSKSSDTDDKDTYQLTTIFIPKITVGSIFQISDDYSGFSDTVIVTNGTATLSDSDSPIMDINVKRLSTYKKEQAKSLKKAMSEDAKSKRALDQKRVMNARARRRKRR